MRQSKLPIIRIFFEKYTPDPGLKKRRNEMYRMRSMILHGSELMQLDQNRAFDWDPPWWNERELHSELWSLMRIAARNWLKTPPAGWRKPSMASFFPAT